MTRDGTNEALAADYDDNPSRAPRMTRARFVRVMGSLITVIAAGLIAGLLSLGIVLPCGVYFLWAVISVASIPLIMQFWTEEVDWRGGRFAVQGTVFVIAILSWVAEVLFSVAMTIVLVGAVRG